MTPRLRIQALAWSPDGQRPLLEGIDLDVGDGELLGLIGPNGSGKTSLLRCAYRFQRPCSGSVELGGEGVRWDITGAMLLGGVLAAIPAAWMVRHIDERGIDNIRILQGDGRELAAALPSACLSRIYILFPDPWPKLRHHKRRLIQPEVIAELARVLKPGGRLRFATDWADYADWTLQRFNHSPNFRWTAERATDWSAPPADHATTRYEEKRLGDCDPVFLDFERV
jgi:tRNA (guanine-N(7)-)-methyltransferase